MPQHPSSQARLIAPIALVVVVIAFFGIVLSSIKLLYTFSNLEIRLKEHAERGRAELHLEGAATFLRLPKLAAVLEQVPADTELHVNFERLSYIVLSRGVEVDDDALLDTLATMITRGFF